MQLSRIPRAVLFDMDGVIFDSERATYETWKAVAARHGFEQLDVPYMKSIGVNAQTCRQHFLDFYGPDFPYDAYQAEQSRDYHARYDHGRLPLKPFVRETLSLLRDRGLGLALASSTRTPVVEAQLRDAGLLPFFSVVIGGDQVSHSKPDPEIFLAAAAALGVSPADCAVIEDSYNGIRAAHRGGMMGIMVPDMLPPTEEMERLAAGILRDLSELPALLGPG